MRIRSNKISAIITFFYEELQGLYNENEIKSFVNLCMEKYAGLNTTELLLSKDETVSESMLLKFKFAINDLKEFKPIQYILGSGHFYGLELKITADVLIPRPETEELVKWIIDDYNKQDEIFSLLDIGFGSGCIAIALKKNIPLADISAIDISESALKIAQINAIENNVHIDFSILDILNQAIWQRLPEMDIIVSNPPYVCESEKALMHANVLNFEPHPALFVHDNDALIFYNAIAEFALLKLKENGSLFFEINERLGLETKALLISKGFSSVELRKDMQGKDRMIKAQIL
ncbi:MAG: peptide chain release factor N(5)-glutamine methyltransferase [Bacteroidetes bacterium]|nr:peptide chain release factor N(5)-glutamine methyltransferase [Bacteroidota bacterium]